MNFTPSILPALNDGVLHPDPIKQFKEWYDVAVKGNVKQPDAMTLATATKDGKPSARTVLLKNVDQQGFVFYTKYESRKGRELSANPYGALVFFWNDIDRAARIEGSLTRISPEESDAYFATRPREGQLSSLTSLQSRVVASRAELDARYEKLKQEYEGKKIPRPSSWGGFRLKPASIEFWQQRFARLNDRILYELQADGSWTMKRLAP